MDTKDLESKLKTVTEAFKNELLGIRSNRPSPKMIEDIQVEYFDQMMPIKQLGTIHVVPPREMQVSVWDQGALQAVAKAIEGSAMGLSVAVTGTIIRVTLPALSDERRAELIKLSKSISETYRIKIRALRDDANKKIEQMEKEKQITEDVKFKSRKKVQEIIDKANAEVEMQLGKKMKEITE